MQVAQSCVFSLVYGSLLMLCSFIYENKLEMEQDVSIVILALHMLLHYLLKHYCQQNKPLTINYKVL